MQRPFWKTPRRLQLVPERKPGFFVKSKEGENFSHPVEIPGSSTGICLIFRGLKFDSDADIGEKGGFRSGTI